MDAVPADTTSRLRRRSPPAWSRRRRARSADARTSARTTERNLHRIALALLLLATLALRLWGIKQGLPYSYNSDEARHYVPRAIAYFAHDYNPNYFLNPPAYSYLLNIVFELWFGSADAVSRAYAAHPTEVFVVARVVVAVLGTLSVWLTYLAGVRMFNRTVGLAAAAIFGLAFLPIFYSHLALNDAPTLAPVALSLYGTAGVLRNGARRDYVLAGIGCGVAAATKYTGAITFVCLLAACLCDGLSGRTVAQSLWRLGLCRCGGDRVRDRQPVLAAGLLGVSRRRDHAAGAGRRLRSGEARHDRHQRDRVLSVDLHLGARLGPVAGGRGRGDRAAGPPTAGAGAGPDPGADHLHDLHGRPAAVLRSLADADVPDRGAARRLWRGLVRDAG